MEGSSFVRVEPVGILAWLLLVVHRLLRLALAVLSSILLWLTVLLRLTILLLTSIMLLTSILLLSSSILLSSVVLLRLWWSGGDPLEEHEKFRLGDDSIALYVEGLHILCGFLCCEAAWFVELHVELVEEGVQFVDVEGAVAVGVVDIEHLVDEHPQNAVVKSLHPIS